ncbi:MAG: VanZ family protein [Clostridia bacterium]|nr:VanZ family protein [Clostridia bacterium]
MLEMLNIDIMTYALMGFLLLCGYLFIFRAMCARISNKKSLPILAFVLLVVYAAVAIPLMIVLSQMGSNSFMLLALLMLSACSVLFVALYGLFVNFKYLNKKMLVLFILYLLMISYVTIFSREEGHSRAILLRFDQLREAIRIKSLEPLQHLFLNAVMFIPLGVLFPLIRPSRLAKMTYVAALGLMLSTMIEATQMFLTIGQCDIEDITANTAGAIIGIILYKVGAAFYFRNRSDEDEDEDEDEA